MSVPEERVSVEMEVPFYDVDPLQIVWHGNYYKYVEVARTKLMRMKGIDGLELVKSNYLLVVIESKCRHSFPLYYGDLFRVDAWFKDIDYRINVGFEIFNKTHNRRAAHGHTILASLDSDGHLLIGTPNTLLERLRR
jgi:acyl-CoA thioester hydrolase